MIWARLITGMSWERAEMASQGSPKRCAWVCVEGALAPCTWWLVESWLRSWFQFSWL